MKFFISVDMEGVAGTMSWEDFEKEGLRYRKIMTNEVNAVIEGIKDAEIEVKKIVVCDSHGKMNNILFEELPKGTLVTRGVPRPYGMMEGLNSTFELVFLIGHHAKAGTVSAPMDHTFSSSSIYSIKVNGKEMSETTINAAYAGHFGVPVGLVAGDAKLIEHTQQTLPEGVEYVVTKYGISRFAVTTRHPKDIEEELREKAKLAVLKAKKTPIFKISPPLELELQLMDTLRTDLVTLIPGIERTSGRTVKFKPKNVAELVRIIRLASILAFTGGQWFK
ncbi:MAG: M55 family metallopeptidase [Candidatus Edwardsbacteria bacterium]